MYEKPTVDEVRNDPDRLDELCAQVVGKHWCFTTDMRVAMELWTRLRASGWHAQLSHDSAHFFFRLHHDEHAACEGKAVSPSMAIALGFVIVHGKVR